MTMSRTLKSNMQRPRGPGWAAFDKKQREKEGAGAVCDVDPYPSISKIAAFDPNKSLMINRCAAVKSFSSVVHPSIDFPVLGSNCKSVVLSNSSDAKHHCDQSTAESEVTPVKLLKDIHVWADQNLIEDVLAAVSGDIDKASALLKAMISPDSKSEETSLSGSSSSAVSYPCKDNNKSLAESNVAGSKLLDGAHAMSSAPLEPEWEEDDMYLSHRKDAIRMMRLASQHSRAASNAFLRGDHVSAQQYSLKAREEWIAAETLNNKAAEEILRIRNGNNDIWRIDLHGLHASEAVSALKDHLHKIESQVVMTRSASSDGLAKLEGGISRSPSFERVSELEMDSKPKKKHLVPQQRQTVLHVITGMGNHSKGQAALPAAVRSFLIENGYHFDDGRAGMIAVRPKFRHK